LSNTKQITIRKYENSDYEQLIEIGKALPQWFTENGISKMQIDLRYQQGFVAVIDSKIIGFLSFITIEGEGQIGWMGVLPKFHRKGIGRTLVDKLTTELKDVGVAALKVYTLGDSVDYEPYAKTRAFYRGVGFTDFQRFEQDDPECPEQLILKMDI
jgi:ribosomal protein S18 acetylase RimI-like enzyme